MNMNRAIKAIKQRVTRTINKKKQKQYIDVPTKIIMLAYYIAYNYKQSAATTMYVRLDCADRSIDLSEYTDSDFDLAIEYAKECIYYE